MGEVVRDSGVGDEYKRKVVGYWDGIGIHGGGMAWPRCWVIGGESVGGKRLFGWPGRGQGTLGSLFGAGVLDRFFGCSLGLGFFGAGTLDSFFGCSLGLGFGGSFALLLTALASDGSSDLGICDVV